jgi:hypothetical protein
VLIWVSVLLMMETVAQFDEKPPTDLIEN